jgi:hypothetical protein
MPYTRIPSDSGYAGVEGPQRGKASPLMVCGI